MSCPEVRRARHQYTPGDANSRLRPGAEEKHPIAPLGSAPVNNAIRVTINLTSISKKTFRETRIKNQSTTNLQVTLDSFLPDNCVI
ncbi:hypothetical protein R5R35_007057 [Gryllus longicercus]|uniref:Uncharacterized protein n=1 Tax=Gryllus longicercus TaxID=2509291 RepID=A0AAN9YW24_9ORTH